MSYNINEGINSSLCNEIHLLWLCCCILRNFVQQYFLLLAMQYDATAIVACEILKQIFCTDTFHDDKKTPNLAIGYSFT